VAQRRGEVTRVDDERVAGPQDLLGHQVDGGREGVLQHLEGDGVEAAVRGGGTGHRASSVTWILMLSHSSITAGMPGGMTVVESSCSMTAGPTMRVPAASAVLSYTGVSTRPPTSSK